MERQSREQLEHISEAFQGDTIRSLAVESVQERSIEQGLGFLCTAKITVNAESSGLIQLTTGASTLVTMHNFYSIAGTSSVLSQFEIFEGATVSVDGSTTDRWITNINRSSAITPEFELAVAPTVTDNGTKLAELASGLSGYTVTANPALQLANDTEYVIKIDNAHTSAVTYYIHFTAYQLEVE
jgi:hypothetical protein